MYIYSLEYSILRKIWNSEEGDVKETLQPLLILI